MLVEIDSEVRGCPYARANPGQLTIGDLINREAILQRNEANPFIKSGKFEKSRDPGWNARMGTPGPQIGFLAPFLDVSSIC